MDLDAGTLIELSQTCWRLDANCFRFPAFLSPLGWHSLDYLSGARFSFGFTCFIDSKVSAHRRPTVLRKNAVSRKIVGRLQAFFRRGPVRADQADADTWEQTEAPAADADQKAVAAASDTAADAQDIATKTGNDAIAADTKTPENADAAAAQTHDTQIAAAVHAVIVQDWQVIEGAVQASAAQAAQDVKAAVQPLPADIISAANAQLSNANAQNADATAKSISLANTQRAALVNQMQTQVNKNIASAQQQLTSDENLPPNSPRINQVNPPPPQNWVQVLNDYIPSASWTTIGTTAALVVGGAALTLIPGVGPILLVAGVGLLAGSAAYNASDRYFNQNQTLSQAFVGGLGSATGVALCTPASMARTSGRGVIWV